MARAYERFTAVFAREPAMTPLRTALTFCLSYPSVSTVIPGMMTIEHVEENVQAGQGRLLSRAELSQLERIFADNTFFIGPNAAQQGAAHATEE